MRVKLSKKDRIEGYGKWAEYRAPKKGEWYLPSKGGVTEALGGLSTPWLVLTPEPPRVKDSEPKYEIVRHEVVEAQGTRSLTADGLTLQGWLSSPRFAGAVYKHPNGTEREIGCVGGVYVDARSKSENWASSTTKFNWLTHMLRPIAILEKREVK